MAEPQQAASPSPTADEPKTKPQVDTSVADTHETPPGSTYATPMEEHPEASIAAAIAPPHPTQSTEPTEPTEPTQTTAPSAPEGAPSDSLTSRPTAVSQATASSSVSGVEPIGPSVTAATTASTTGPSSTAGPTINITLLLTTGARHPYKIDMKYLRKRDVTVQGDDPFNISVYTLKELIWRDWRSEWEARPSSPAYIRLINMGRMLDDKVPLKECRFNHESPNIVHMTVKPQELFNDDEDNAKSGKISRYRDDGEGPTTGCKCVIL